MARDLIEEHYQRERLAALLDGSAFEISVVVSVQKVNVRHLEEEALRVGGLAFLAWRKDGRWHDDVSGKDLVAVLMNDIVMAPMSSNRNQQQWIGTYRVGILKEEGDA